MFINIYICNNNLVCQSNILHKDFFLKTVFIGYQKEMRICILNCARYKNWILVDYKHCTELHQYRVNDNKSVSRYKTEKTLVCTGKVFG